MTPPSETLEQEDPPIENGIHNETLPPPHLMMTTPTKEDQNIASENVLQMKSIFLHKKSSSREVTILLVYVDDMTVTGNDALGIVQLQTPLKREFDIKALG